MLLWRVVTAAIGIPVLVIVVIKGGLFLLFLTVLLAVLGFAEFCRIMEAMGLTARRTIGYAGSALLPGLAFLISGGKLSGEFAVLTVFLLLLAGLVQFLGSFSKEALISLAVTYWGIFFTGGLLSYLVLLRDLPGANWLLIVIVLTWCSDTGAYFAGKWLGRHYLAPVISPKKTWEGLAGGMIMTVAAAVMAARFTTHMTAVQAVNLGLLTGLAGLVGDLTESALKRIAGLKDAGRLLPGHGGVLDRFDSLLIIAPVVYYYLLWFIII